MERGVDVNFKLQMTDVNFKLQMTKKIVHHYLKKIGYLKKTRKKMRLGFI